MGIIDNSPIEKGGNKKIEDKDLFNFKFYAKKVQKMIQNNSNNSSPLTIGIYGKWGEGKTSFLNLVENQIDIWRKEDRQKGVLIYHFNPWRYSTEDEMLFDFFEGLAKPMYLDKDNAVKRKIGKKLIKYSRYAKAIKLSASVGISSSNKVGATFDATEIMKALGEDFVGKEVTLDSLIKDINKKLEESKYKIVVFVDDIDRLDKDEIYTILKLIKLNANFKNFVYLIALDEDYVAKAISKRYGENIEDGRLFLEKVINIPIHLPKVEEVDFKNFFDVKLNDVINNLDFSGRKVEVNEIKNEFQYHYFKNGREVIRVLNSFFVSAFAIGEDVNLRDLFWLEFLKIEYSSVFKYLKNYNASFINRDLITINDLFEEKDSVKEYNKTLEGDSFDVVEILFPKSNNIFGEEKRRTDLRINHKENFEKYFSYHTERKIPSFQKNELFQNIRDKDLGELKQNLTYLRDDKRIKISLFEGLIKEFIFDQEEKNNRDFFYDFLFSNLNLLEEGRLKKSGLECKLRFIKYMSKIISVNERQIKLPLEKLSLEELFVFTNELKIESNVLSSYEGIFLKKVKEKLNVEKVLLIDSGLERKIKRYVLTIWKKDNSVEYNDQMKEFLDDLESIKKLLSLSLSQQLDDNILDNKEYRSICNYVETDVVYREIKNYSQELILGVDPKQKFGDFLNDEKNGVLEQFVYWYKKKNKL